MFQGFLYFNLLSKKQKNPNFTNFLAYENREYRSFSHTTAAYWETVDEIISKQVFFIAIPIRVRSIVENEK